METFESEVREAIRKLEAMEVDPGSPEHAEVLNLRCDPRIGNELKDELELVMAASSLRLRDMRAEEALELLPYASESLRDALRPNIMLDISNLEDAVAMVEKDRSLLRMIAPYQLEERRESLASSIADLPPHIQQELAEGLQELEALEPRVKALQQS